MVIAAFELENLPEDVLFKGFATCLCMQTERFIAGCTIVFELLGMVDLTLFPVVLREFVVESFDWIHIKCLRTVSKVVYTCNVCIIRLRTLVGGHFSCINNL